MQLALGLAIFLVYVIMASTFESVLHPFVILLSVPLALVGVVCALFVTSTAISVVVLIGAIVLSGVVVNNAIVLVDTINQQRANGLSRLDAIKAGASLRLRPILITTLTTVLGLMPLHWDSGGQIQRPWRSPSRASPPLVLTLGVIPVVYLALPKPLNGAANDSLACQAQRWTPRHRHHDVFGAASRGYDCLARHSLGNDAQPIHIQPNVGVGSLSRLRSTRDGATTRSAHRRASIDHTRSPRNGYARLARISECILILPPIRLHGCGL